MAFQFPFSFPLVFSKTTKRQYAASIEAAISFSKSFASSYSVAAESVVGAWSLQAYIGTTMPTYAGDTSYGGGVTKVEAYASSFDVICSEKSAAFGLRVDGGLAGLEWAFPTEYSITNGRTYEFPTEFSSGLLGVVHTFDVSIETMFGQPSSYTINVEDVISEYDVPMEAGIHRITIYDVAEVTVSISAKTTNTPVVVDIGNQTEPRAVGFTLNAGIHRPATDNQGSVIVDIKTQSITVTACRVNLGLQAQEKTYETRQDCGVKNWFIGNSLIEFQIPGKVLNFPAIVKSALPQQITYDIPKIEVAIHRVDPEKPPTFYNNVDVRVSFLTRLTTYTMTIRVGLSKQYEALSYELAFGIHRVDKYNCYQHAILSRIIEYNVRVFVGIPSQVYAPQAATLDAGIHRVFIYDFPVHVICTRTAVKPATIQVGQASKQFEAYSALYIVGQRRLTLCDLWNITTVLGCSYSFDSRLSTGVTRSRIHGVAIDAGVKRSSLWSTFYWSSFTRISEFGSAQGVGLNQYRLYDSLVDSGIKRTFAWPSNYWSSCTKEFLFRSSQNIGVQQSTQHNGPFDAGVRRNIIYPVPFDAMNTQKTYGFTASIKAGLSMVYDAIGSSIDGGISRRQATADRNPTAFSVGYTVSRNIATREYLGMPNSTLIDAALNAGIHRSFIYGLDYDVSVSGRLVSAAISAVVGMTISRNSAYSSLDAGLLRAFRFNTHIDVVSSSTRYLINTLVRPGLSTSKVLDVPFNLGIHRQDFLPYWHIQPVSRGKVYSPKIDAGIHREGDMLPTIQDLGVRNTTLYDVPFKLDCLGISRQTGFLLWAGVFDLLQVDIPMDVGVRRSFGYWNIYEGYIPRTMLIATSYRIGEKKIYNPWNAFCDIAPRTKNIALTLYDVSANRIKQFFSSYSVGIHNEWTFDAMISEIGVRRSAIGPITWELSVVNNKHYHDVSIKAGQHWEDAWPSELSIGYKNWTKFAILASVSTTIISRWATRYEVPIRRQDPWPTLVDGGFSRDVFTQTLYSVSCNVISQWPTRYDGAISRQFEWPTLIDGGFTRDVPIQALLGVSCTVSHYFDALYSVGEKGKEYYGGDIAADVGARTDGRFDTITNISAACTYRYATKQSAGLTVEGSLAPSKYSVGYSTWYRWDTLQAPVVNRVTPFNTLYNAGLPAVYDCGDVSLETAVRRMLKSATLVETQVHTEKQYTSRYSVGIHRVPTWDVSAEVGRKLTSSHKTIEDVGYVNEDDKFYTFVDLYFFVHSVAGYPTAVGAGYKAERGVPINVTGQIKLPMAYPTAIDVIMTNHKEQLTRQEVGVLRTRRTFAVDVSPRFVDIYTRQWKFPTKQVVSATGTESTFPVYCSWFRSTKTRRIIVDNASTPKSITLG